MFRVNHPLLQNYKKVIFTYGLLFLGLISPYLLFDNVVSPHRQLIEVGVIESNFKVGYIENRKFSDFTSNYIPEISEHLKASHSGWLTLWTNNNELGRPLYHISGFSPAYFPSWIILQFTDNPLRFITTLSLFNCFLAGFFVILFCREIGLTPLAGLIAGTSLSSSPLFMYWLTFPMFPAVWCWSACALWAVTRLARKLDIVGWSALAFSIYSLLMTAYPQLVVFHAYILLTYGMYLAYRVKNRGSLELGRFALIVVSALFVSVILVLPVYIDLSYVALESARVAPDPSFFTYTLPKFDTLIEVLRFIVLSTTPELFGNPVETNYPFPYDGLSITSLVVFFTVIGLLSTYRKTWGWWLAIVFICLLAFVQPFYLLGIKYLGFNISRSNPLGSIMVPLTIIMAYGADALVKRTRLGVLSRQVFIGVASVLMVVVFGLAFGFINDVSIRWGMVLSVLILLGLLAAQYNTTSHVMLLVALILVLVTISYPLMLRQDPTQIATTSPLIEKLRKNLPEDSRFAVAAPGLLVLPPNLNAGLGIASVHSYNSLSSRRYHSLIKTLGGKMQTYGRRNTTISPDYNSAMFWMSNISMILSPTKLSHENLEYLGEESGVYLHKVISRMGDSIQVILSPDNIEGDHLQMSDPRELSRYTTSKQLDQGDFLEYEVAQGAPSILVLSQKYHRDWQAKVLEGETWVLANTTVVNGVFQGVILSSDAQRVRLEFKPFARFAWIGHVFWLSLLVLFVLKVWQRRRTLAKEGLATR